MAGTRKSKRDPTGYPDFTLPIGLLMQLIPVKLVPDWGAIEAEDVDVTGGATGDSGLFLICIEYTVPTGKTLLIYDWSAALNTADGQIVAQMLNKTTWATLSWGAGARGFQTSFSKPKRLASGHVLQIAVRQDTGLTQTVLAHFGGVLI